LRKDTINLVFNSSYSVFYLRSRFSTLNRCWDKWICCGTVFWWENSWRVYCAT